MNMQHPTITAALAFINENEYTALDTPTGVHDALLNTCADWYSDLAHDSASGSLEHSDEVAFAEAEAVLDALRAVIGPIDSDIPF